MSETPFYSLCSDDELTKFFEYSDKRSIERRVKDDSSSQKIKKYNSMQVMTFLDKEGISEDVLYTIVKFYNSILNDRGIVKTVFDKVAEKGLPDGKYLK